MFKFLRIAKRQSRLQVCTAKVQKNINLQRYFVCFIIILLLLSHNCNINKLNYEKTDFLFGSDDVLAEWVC